VRQQNGEIYYEVVGTRRKLPARAALQKAVDLAKQYSTDVCVIDDASLWHPEWGRLT
jgi:hypothetical protein